MRRTPSQNVIFRGESTADDQFEPRGRGIAKKLLCQIRADGFDAADEDNWRDCGWSIDVSASGTVLQLALAETDETGRWIADVAPLCEPGIIAQLFGRKFVDRSEDVLSLSLSVSRFLRQSGFSDILWCVDGFPDIGNGTPEPITQ